MINDQWKFLSMRRFLLEISHIVFKAKKRINIFCTKIIIFWLKIFDISGGQFYRWYNNYNISG